MYKFVIILLKHCEMHFCILVYAIEKNSKRHNIVQHRNIVTKHKNSCTPKTCAMRFFCIMFFSVFMIKVGCRFKHVTTSRNFDLTFGLCAFWMMLPLRPLPNFKYQTVNACYDVHKKYHSLTIFSTYLNFMHHGGKLENICSLKFCNR